MKNWDLTFMYGHDQILSNPLVTSSGGFFSHYRKLDGKRVRVFSDYQAKWVKRNNGVIVR
jgi:hypothetical protein